MQIILGWFLLIVPGLLWLLQLNSSINFQLAQKLGIQEKPELTSSVVQRSERYTAYWDLITLCWLPIVGLLMILNHRFWPFLAAAGAIIYMDAAGRELAKYLSFKKESFKLGTALQQRWFLTSYFVMFAIGLTTFSYAVIAITNH